VGYDRRNGSSILAAWQTAEAGEGTCDNSTSDLDIFFVRVVDDHTIKLTTTSAAATASDEAPYDVTVADPSHLQLTSIPSGLAVGTPVVYQAPVAATFATGSVDVTVVDLVPGPGVAPQTGTCPGTLCGLTIHNDGGNNILVELAAYNALAAGQAVRYAVKTGTPITGLSNGGTYYVIKNGGAIQLADSYCHAVGTVGDSSCVLPDGPDADSDPDPIAVTALTLSIFTATGLATHRPDRRSSPRRPGPSRPRTSAS
jgi:hypothetical protein